MRISERTCSVLIYFSVESSPRLFYVVRKFVGCLSLRRIVEDAVTKRRNGRASVIVCAVFRSRHIREKGLSVSQSVSQSRQPERSRRQDVSRSIATSSLLPGAAAATATAAAVEPPLVLPNGLPAPSSAVSYRAVNTPYGWLVAAVKATFSFDVKLYLITIGCVKRQSAAAPPRSSALALHCVPRRRPPPPPPRRSSNLAIAKPDSHALLHSAHPRARCKRMKSKDGD